MQYLFNNRKQYFTILAGAKDYKLTDEENLYLLSSRAQQEFYDLFDCKAYLFNMTHKLHNGRCFVKVRLRRTIKKWLGHADSK